MLQAKQVDYYTPEEYLALEVQAQERNEYLDGEIVPMVGGLPNHNRLILNLASTLNFSLRKQPYDVFVTDQRLWIPKRRVYTYPDVMIVQGELQLQAGRNDTITNPLVIVEVLSKSTQAYDRGEKFKFYRTIPTFQEYVLVDQYSMSVEQYYKTGDSRWLFSETEGEEAILKLNTINFEITLTDLYDKVTFDDSAE